MLFVEGFDLEEDVEADYRADNSANDIKLNKIGNCTY